MKKILILMCMSVASFGQQLTTSNLPILSIRTDNSATIPDEPKIGAELTIFFKGNGQTNAISDAPNFKGRIGIERRGSTSQDLSPKKPYGFETHTAQGNNLDVSLLGLPADNDWVLLAPYSDKSLMRDVLTHWLGNQTGRYSSRTRMCEVILNGDYQGVYVLMEKIKRGKDRINISNLKTTDIAGDALTGGYILKIDKTSGSKAFEFLSIGTNRFNNSSFPLIQVDEPKLADIQPQQSTYIKNQVRDMERALLATNYTDPDVGYRKWLDMQSLVDYFILTELSRNTDGYRLSTYFYKDRDSKNPKFIMGPFWDYNIAYGNANYCQGQNTTGWAYDFSSVCPGDFFQMPFWWERIVADPAFQIQVKARWTQLRQNVITPERINAYLDSTATAIAPAATRNFQRWPILGQYVWPNSFVGNSYAQEMTFLKDWIRRRIIWLDGAMPNVENILTSIPIQAQENGLLVYPNPGQGELRLRYEVTDPLGEWQVLIIDARGRNAMESEVYQPERGTNEVLINTADLPSGSYTLALTQNGQKIGTARWVK